LIQNVGTGALEVDPASIAGNGDITSGTLTVGGDANALLGDVTIEIPADAITATMINANVAGTGLIQNVGTGALEVDPASIAGNGDITSGTLTVGGDANALLGDVTIEIADGAITSLQIANGTITDIDISNSAAIDGLKILPDFGGQNIVTLGDISVRDITATGQIYSDNEIAPIPDYVFQKYFLGNSDLKENYNFQSLVEIEAFIKKHHHLPGIVSAKEAKAAGKWNLSESNLQNLEKIEELFLHTIEQEKKIEQLKTENESLSAELLSLRKDMDEIKALLQNKH